MLTKFWPKPLIEEYFRAPDTLTTSSSTILPCRAIATISSGFTRNRVSSMAASPVMTPPPTYALANSACTSATQSSTLPSTISTRQRGFPLPSHCHGDGPFR